MFSFNQWNLISTAPRDGRDIMLFDKIHGQIQGRFIQGEWSNHHEYGRQYSGSLWVLGDDIYQIEVEEFTNEGQTIFFDGSITHWKELDPPPEQCA